MYELVSFVVRSKTRKLVLEQLKEPKTPTQVSHILRLHRSSVSRTILSLEKKGLVECLTPNEKMGRFYGITKIGVEVLNKIRRE